jgi:hypothetical protein
MPLENPFQTPGNWYRSNFHAHTTTSDGNESPAELVARYRDGGYQVLAITDHGKTNDLTGLSSAGFLAMPGIELHPAPPRPDAELYHVVALNVPIDFKGVGRETSVEDLMAALRKVNAPCILAHPHWCGYSLNDTLPVTDAIAVEVWNSTCRNAGRAVSSVHWDDLLESGRFLGGIAVDDIHRPGDFGLGWTQVKAAELSCDAIVDALRRGCYYASCGPEILDVQQDGFVFQVRCSPAQEVRFLANRYYGRRITASEGELLETAEVTVSPPPWAPASATYVRIEVVDEQGRTAWTNPFRLPPSAK